MLDAIENAKLNSIPLKIGLTLQELVILKYIYHGVCILI